MNNIWMRRFTDYVAHPDMRTALANMVALLIVSNQPFYPLYVYWIVGNPAWITVVTFLSTPFFFAVPAVARRNSLAGRILMCVAGTLNTVLCMWAFGTASGVELFYLPCILLGAILFRPTEKLAALFCVGLPMVAYLVLHGRLGAPLHVFSADEYTSLVSLHAFSVGCLIALIGYSFSTRSEVRL
jgi:hypothetical protein